MCIQHVRNCIITYYYTERGYFDSVATFHDSWTKCRSSSECPNSIITWCINLYHPTERVQMCMNKEGIINATDYARHLQLECYFSVGVSLIIPATLMV